MKSTPYIKVNDISRLLRLGVINYGLIEDGANMLICDQSETLDKKVYVSDLLDDNNMRYIAGFGALKSDPEQEIAIVMRLKKEGNNIITIKINKFLTPSKNGAINAITVNRFNIGLSTEDKKDGVFSISNGFTSFPQ